MDIGFHHVTDIEIDASADPANRWVDLKIKWAGFGEAGTQEISLFVRNEDAWHRLAEIIPSLKNFEAKSGEAA